MGSGGPSNIVNLLNVSELKMVTLVHFTLCVLYHNKKKFFTVNRIESRLLSMANKTFHGLTSRVVSHVSPCDKALELSSFHHGVPSSLLPSNLISGHLLQEVPPPLDSSYLTQKLLPNLAFHIT